GQDLQRDPQTGKLFAVRKNYFDARGKNNNTLRNRPTTDEDQTRYIRNVYSVLMTRAIKGTHVYAPHLRTATSRLRPHVSCPCIMDPGPPPSSGSHNDSAPAGPDDLPTPVSPGRRALTALGVTPASTA